MKEVERISLGGYAFTLDEDASALASEYLGSLENHYAKREGGAEILEGIEERMAELLMEKTGHEGVGSRAMIEEIIAILGRPEDIEEGDAPDEPANDGHGQSDPDGKEASAGGTRPRRKLYRDMNDKMIAGVCGGLATYFKLDPALFRILFVVLTLVSWFGLRHGGHIWYIHVSFPLLYVILWICMPAAKTARQRWEQRGEDGTLNGIQQSVKAGAREVGDAINSFANSDAGKTTGNVLGKLIGLVLLIIAFSVLFAGGVWGFGSGFLGHRIGDGLFGIGRLYDQGMSDLYGFVPGLAGMMATPFVRILLMMVLFLPFIGILYGALQLLFGFKSPKWHPGLVIFILWLLSIIATGILLMTGILTTEMISI